MIVNILFAGVGGQGIVTASDLVADAAVRAGWAVKKAETHGMAQRGGSVVSHVRMADSGTVYSPLIPEGKADFLVALELLEGVRALPWLAPEGKVIADARRLDPASVALGAVAYPPDLEEALRQRGTVVRATEHATKLGEPRAANALLLGVLSRSLRIDNTTWRAAFAGCLKPSVVDINWQAFELGQTLAEGGF